MLKNSDLFLECLEMPVRPIDPNNRELLNNVVIENEDTKINEIQKRNTELMNLMSKFDKCKSDKEKNKIIDDIDKCIDYPDMNLGPFSQYMMVHDINHKIYINELTNEEKIFVVKSYLKDRHKLYADRGYPDITYQVLSDNYSHKRKGNLGVKKLEKICIDFGLAHIENEEQINNYSYYFLPDSKDKKLLQPVLDKYNIKFSFRNTHQNKLPDAVIKYDNYFLFIEHKLIKQTGGGQDKQINEIIDFIKEGERGIFYISFLDGMYFNSLIAPKKTNKLFTIKNDIINALNANPYNYFVNAFGFKKLLKNIIKS